jgi:transposase
MQLTTMGMDLAKNVFQRHGADDKGRTLLKRQLRRAQVLPFFANLAPCKFGMEACGSAHYWAGGSWQALGHAVQLIAPQCVKARPASAIPVAGRGTPAVGRASMSSPSTPNAIPL